MQLFNLTISLSLCGAPEVARRYMAIALAESKEEAISKAKQKYSHAIRVECTDSGDVIITDDSWF